MMKQKLQFIPIIILLFLFFTSTSIQANEGENLATVPLSPQELVDAQLENMDLTELKQYWEDIQTKYGGFLPESQKGSLDDFVKGDKKFTFKDWTGGILKFLFH